jgi:hypothetical protein
MDLSANLAGLRSTRGGFISAASAAALGVLVGATPGAFAAQSRQVSPRATRAFALSPSNELLGFDPVVPAFIRSRVAVMGLAQGEQLVGIDFRPASGRLYGVSSASQLYVIDHLTGNASRIGGAFSTPLQGTEFGVDFNPVVDRIRVVSNTGQNLRINPDTGAVAAVDQALKFAAGDANSGKTPRVVAAAYTNPDTDPTTGTTLYDIDAGLDVLVTQNPPNDGVLNTVGPLGVDAGDLVGFDIAPGVGLTVTRNGAATPGAGATAGVNISNMQGFAALQPAGSNAARLYTIDLGTGKATDRGMIGRGEAVRGLAVSLDSILCADA